MTRQLADSVRIAAERLRVAGVEDPADDAWRLAHEAVMRVRGYRPVPHEEVDEEVSKLLADWLGQRESRRPVSQIIGYRSFYDSEFAVNSDVLDPRPDSEVLVDAGLRQRPGRILDLGTGSGCLVLSILKRLPCATGVGVDLSETALEVARSNCRQLGLCDRARFIRSDWFKSVSGRFDLIIANPPYLSESEYDHSPPELMDWEPRLALTTGGDGLEAYRTIAAGTCTYLAPLGRLVLEIGFGGLRPVRQIAEQSALRIEEVIHDLANRPRALICTSI